MELLSRPDLPDPTAPVATRGTVDALADLVAAGGVCVLTGAGISTASGIPDYRGVTGRARRATPMRHADFVSSGANRRRYWARSLVGWQTIDRVRPNVAHRAVADLEAAGLVDHVVTQNVDGLHQAAGSTRVVELHGTLATVTCLACAGTSSREALQAELARRNPAFVERDAAVSADGDAHVADDDAFEVVDCPCGGALMPDVVFFGAGVPRDVVDTCYRLVESCRSLLVLGSSLFVWSGLRFVRHARGHGRPIAIVNHGPTRADALASIRLDADLTDVLPDLAGQLGDHRPATPAGVAG